MASLKAGIEKAHFATPPSTRLMAVAEIFGMQPPVSLKKVARLLEPQTRDWYSGPIETKLVSGSAHLRVTSTGSWTFTGAFTDRGAGAHFVFFMTPLFVDAAGKTVVFGETDTLSDDETASFDKDGRDLWIARNWSGIRQGGFTWRINASAQQLGNIGDFLLDLLGAGLTIWGASECNDQQSWTVQQDQNGNATAVCQVN